MPFYVKCCTTYFNANFFGLFVGLIALEMFRGLHFLGITAKKWVVGPQKWRFFLFGVNLSYLGQFHSVLDDFKQPAYL